MVGLARGYDQKTCRLREEDLQKFEKCCLVLCDTRMTMTFIRNVYENSSYISNDLLCGNMGYNEGGEKIRCK